MDGVSLLPLVRGDAEPRDHYYAETLGIRAVVRDGWKYIWHLRGADELYGLEADPMEAINLAGDEAERAEALRGELFRWVEEDLGGRPDPMPAQLARVEELREERHRFL